MFGYIKPDKENLLVKDLALYKASYCGLCSVIKKNVSFFLPFTLSYDFVFLAMIRSAIRKEECKIRKGRCVYNPFKKCAIAICEDETLYTARAALILTALKLEDDAKDGDVALYKRFIIKPFHAYLNSRVKGLLKSNPEYCELLDKVKSNLSELAEIERSRSSDIDRCCEVFGEIMADITAFGLTENEALIAREIGSATGRYIYMIDAIDDFERDGISNSYNPLIERYGSVDEVRKNVNELDIALAMFAKRAKLASDLLSEGKYSRIIDNIFEMGMGLEAYKVITRKRVKK